MKLIISTSSDLPIYAQIKQQIINQIITGSLIRDEMLPSIRSLAKDIRISVLTVKKAYDELEKEGYVITRQGKGSYVSNTNIENARKDKMKEIEDDIERIVKTTKCYNIDKDDVIKAFNLMYERNDNNEYDNRD